MRLHARPGRQPDEETDIPTIAIEYVSQGKRDWLRDYEEKRREYLALGVAEYWVVDPELDAMLAPMSADSRAKAEAEVKRWFSSK